MRLPRSALALAAGAGLLLAACGDDDGGAVPATTAPGAAPSISPERCEANRAVGPLTYVTSFDYAAAAGIVDVIVADARGFYDELCLDVRIQPGFAPSNAQLVAGGAAQFSSAGSFGELFNSNAAGAELVGIANYGKTAIEALVVPADSPVQELADLKGKTIGVKGDIPYSIQTMLGQAGVTRDDVDELLLDTYDPVAGFDRGIDALPVYKSNEPNTLEQAGFAFRSFDPLTYDVPSSFGVHFTSRQFLDDHPAVVEDFLRATFKGFEDAVADPAGAVDAAVALAQTSNAGLTAETETFRWTTESDIVTRTTPEGQPPGLVDLALVQREVDALVAAGVLDEAPDLGVQLDAELARRLFDGTTLRWPG